MKSKLWAVKILWYLDVLYPVEQDDDFQLDGWKKFLSIKEYATDTVKCDKFEEYEKAHD